MTAQSSGVTVSAAPTTIRADLGRAAPSSLPTLVESNVREDKLMIALAYMCPCGNAPRPWLPDGQVWLPPVPLHAWQNNAGRINVLGKHVVLQAEQAAPA